MAKDFLDTLLDLPSGISDQVTSLFSDSTIKIAITGLSRSGKTVFITSLIDQLLHQNRILSVTTGHTSFKTSLKAPLHNIRRFTTILSSTSLKMSRCGQM